MQNLSQPFPKPAHASNDKEARRKPVLHSLQESLSLYRDGYWVNLRCLSHEVSALIGCQFDGGMIIMQGMGHRCSVSLMLPPLVDSAGFVATYAGSH